MRISLRNFLIACIALAAALGMVGREIVRCRQGMGAETAIVEQIRARGGDVRRGAAERSWLTLLLGHRWPGARFTPRVTAVTFLGIVPTSTDPASTPTSNTLDPAFVRSWLDFSHLQTVMVSKGELPSESVVVLARAANLQQLVCFHEAHQLGPRSLTLDEANALGQAPQLWRVKLSQFCFDPDSLRALLAAPQLVSLDLSLGRMSRGSFGDALAEATALRELSVQHTSFDDADLRALRNHSRLQKLNLEKTRVSDASIEELAAMKSLNQLSLVGSAVSDEGLRRLRRLRPDIETTRQVPLSINRPTLDEQFGARPEVAD